MNNTTEYRINVGTTVENHSNSSNGENIATVQNYSTMLIVTYIGASISIIGILLTLMAYIGYKKFQVKRTHIVMVNLCVCYIVYFVSYLISNNHRHHYEFETLETIVEHPMCVAGAFLGHLGMLGAWFWLTAYWFILLVMFKKPMGGHISRFFLKSALPAYGITFAIAIICLVVSFTRKEIYTVYSSELCFLKGNYLNMGVILPSSLLLVVDVVILMYVSYGMVWVKPNGRFQRLGSLQRIKVHLYKLSVITMLTAIMIIGTAVIPAIRIEGNTKAHLISVIVFTLLSSALGIVLMILFCLHQDEIRAHWMAIILGKKDPAPHKSTYRGKMDVDGNFIGTMKREESYYGNGDLVGGERQRSTYRMVAKDDTDMTTLGLIQIPGTPSNARTNLNGETSQAKANMTSVKTEKKRTGSSSSMLSVSKKQKDDQTTPLNEIKRKKKDRRSYSTSARPSNINTSANRQSAAFSDDPPSPVTTFV
uniref:Neurotensin-like peptide 2 receptor n=3 Tax=Ciona intestinalis TaxID=7719 RepID=A0A1W2W3R2_CIOIN|nr:adhesion G-protein coupled receptor G2-like [Ciona intestinalis]BBC53700.1 neurotensin-like peptide 2 receptor [Ciona intestinalis]|eukprot:XP_002123529.1 adhesion G-protein coupled receptor G2-like [Ciona intestinalis]